MKKISGLDTSLAPGFLIASPRLDGGPFERAVIVMVHHDEEGAMGFIVNKPLGIDFGSLLESADDQLGGEIDARCFDVSVHFGGPVRVEQLWLIYNESPGDPTPERAETIEDDGQVRFDDLWYLVAASDSIESFAYGERSSPFKPFIGYTGWGPGQLEGEIEEGSWLCLDFDSARVIGGDDEACWGEALGSLGVDPMAFMMMGKAGSA